MTTMTTATTAQGKLTTGLLIIVLFGERAKRVSLSLIM